jgi:hypothetical protein
VDLEDSAVNQADIESSSAAEAAFERAWSDPRHTQIELSPLDVNRVVAANYVTSAPATMTAAQLWDNAVKKASDPVTYLPGPVRSSTTFGHRKLSGGAETFVRLTEQRMWLTPSEYRPVIELVVIDHHKRRATFLGAREARRDDGTLVRIEPTQPLFDVEHAVGGSETAPLDLWRIVHRTDAKDERLIEKFAHFQDLARVPGYVAVYFQRELGIELHPRGEGVQAR